jgi:AraC-like DNA-binding protein
MGKLLLASERLEELAQAATYDAKKLAQLCGISTRQLQRDFRRRFQCSPQRWLNNRRMMAAQKLLLSGEPIKKVAFDLGFKHTSHFCRKFKCCNKMTPSEFTHSPPPMSLAYNNCR